MHLWLFQWLSRLFELRDKLSKAAQLAALTAVAPQRVEALPGFQKVYLGPLLQPW